MLSIIFSQNHLGEQTTKGRFFVFCVCLKLVWREGKIWCSSVTFQLRGSKLTLSLISPPNPFSKTAEWLKVLLLLEPHWK